MNLGSYLSLVWVEQHWKPEYLGRTFASRLDVAVTRRSRLADNLADIHSLRRELGVTLMPRAFADGSYSARSSITPATTTAPLTMFGITFYDEASRVFLLAN